MRTRSQSRNSNRQQQQVSLTFVEPFNLVEPIPEVTMDDTRTMAQLLEAPTMGYEDAIIVPEITTDNFELKHGLLTLGLGFENQNDDVNPSLLNKAKELAPCLYNIDEIGNEVLSDHKIISEEELKREAEKWLKGGFWSAGICEVCCLGAGVIRRKGWGRAYPQGGWGWRGSSDFVVCPSETRAVCMIGSTGVIVEVGAVAGHECWWLGLVDVCGWFLIDVFYEGLPRMCGLWGSYWDVMSGMLGAWRGRRVLGAGCEWEPCGDLMVWRWGVWKHGSVLVVARMVRSELWGGVRDSGEVVRVWAGVVSEGGLDGGLVLRVVGGACTWGVRWAMGPSGCGLGSVAVCMGGGCVGVDVVGSVGSGGVSVVVGLLVCWYAGVDGVWFDTGVGWELRGLGFGEGRGSRGGGSRDEGAVVVKVVISVGVGGGLSSGGGGRGFRCAFGKVRDERRGVIKKSGEKNILFGNETSSFETKIKELEMTLAQQTKDFEDAKVDFSKKTDKFETYFKKHENTKVVLERQLDRKIQDSNAKKDQFLKQIASLESKLASQELILNQKEYSEFGISYNALKAKFDALNPDKGKSPISNFSTPKVSVSKKIYTGESSKSFQKKVSQFTTYSLQKDRKFSKKPKVFETPTHQKVLKSNDSSEKI
ncbi:hypothetical protein Tco_1302062 [Tanacetum coccineum]